MRFSCAIASASEIFDPKSTEDQSKQNVLYEHILNCVCVYAWYYHIGCSTSIDIGCAAGSCIVSF